MTSTGDDIAAALDRQARRRVEQVGSRLADQVGGLTDVLYHELVDRIVELQGDPIILDLLHASTQGNLENVAHLVQGHIPLDHLEVPTTANEYARRVAQRGIPLDALLRAYRLGQRRFLDWAFAQLSELEPDPAVCFAAARSVTGTTFEYVDRISEGVVEAYQVEREQWLASRNTVRVEVLESLLAGEPVDIAAAESGLGHRLRQHHLGLVVWQTRGGAGAHDLRGLEKLVGEVGRCLGATAPPLFISRDRETAWAWLSLGRSTVQVDVATLTDLVLGAGSGIRVALGTPAVAESGFRTTHFEALKAQQVAMAGHDQAPPVTSYGDAGVRAAALLTGDLESTRRLVASALGGLATDSETAARLRDTLLTFIRSNDSYVATAELVHLHKNTVKYRVDKAIEARGKPLDQDRLDLELALVACQWLAPQVLRSPG